MSPTKILVAVALACGLLATPVQAAQAPDLAPAASVVEDTRALPDDTTEAKKTKKSKKRKNRKNRKNRTDKATINRLVRAKVTPSMTKKQARLVAKRTRKEPAPRSVKRYSNEPANRKQWQRLFYRLPTTEWGGGDVSISIRLTSGRRLWMYGDTFSDNNGFVNSSAIVTSGRSIRVANGGRQILPPESPDEDGRKVVYWVETLTPVKGEYAVVTAAPFSIGTNGQWDFYRADERSRAGLVHVDKFGNVNFVHWTKYVKRPNIGMDGDDFAIPEPGHYTYAQFVHPIRLKNGQFLMTRNRNYDPGIYDGQYEMWRPLFLQSKTRNRPYWGR